MRHALPRPTPPRTRGDRPRRRAGRPAVRRTPAEAPRQRARVPPAGGVGGEDRARASLAVAGERRARRVPAPRLAGRAGGADLPGRRPVRRPATSPGAGAGAGPDRPRRDRAGSRGLSLRCLSFLDANDFWRAAGFTLLDTEPGAKGPLNVWAKQLAPARVETGFVRGHTDRGVNFAFHSRLHPCPACGRPTFDTWTRGAVRRRLCRECLGAGERCRNAHVLPV